MHETKHQRPRPNPLERGGAECKVWKNLHNTKQGPDYKQRKYMHGTKNQRPHTQPKHPRGGP